MRKESLVRGSSKVVYQTYYHEGGYESQKEEPLFASRHHQHLNSVMAVIVVISER